MGFQWFNDVWCYDPAVNQWTQLDCIGYIPAPREGHAAALVDDVMYVFGGRTEEGTDLGDLAAFRLSSRRWYTFQNMGPSPSPRSGHSMTTVGKSIVVLGGEPSSATTTINDLGIMYVLDTAKIRYPNDSQPGPQRVQQSARQPGANDANRQTPVGAAQDARKPGITSVAAVSSSPVGNSTNGHNTPPPMADVTAVQQQSPGAQSAPPSKVPRSAVTPSPAGPPPQGPTPAKPLAETAANGRPRAASSDRVGASGSQQATAAPSSALNEADSPINGRRTPTQASQAASQSRSGSKQEPPAIEAAKVGHRGHRQVPGSVDSSAENSMRAARPSSPPSSRPVSSAILSLGAHRAGTLKLSLC